MNLFLDIETIPAEEEKHEILKAIHQKKVENGKKVSAKFEEYLLATSFDGAFGRIVCIGYAIDDESAQILQGSEKEMLKEFWDIAKDVNLFIGFNCMDFDLRFIYQRSIISGVMPTQNLSFARYRSSPIFDVMYEWSKWDTKSLVSLDTLTKALGLESSKDGGIEGKDVWKFYQAGKIKEICDYCKKDVEVTRQIYKKMVFAQQEKLPF